MAARYDRVEKEGICADGINELADKVKEMEKDGWILRRAFAIVVKGNPVEIMKHKYHCLVAEEIEEDEDNTIAN